jgi:hypothetical protein
MGRRPRPPRPVARYRTEVVSRIQGGACAIRAAVLACKHPTLLRILDMTSVDGVVAVAATVDEAAAALEWEKPRERPRTPQLG